MSATEYTYDSRDLGFLLFEQLKVQELCKFDRFQDFEKEDFEMIVSEAIKFAKDQMAPYNREGDEVGCKLEDGQVYVPPVFKQIYKNFADAGWLAATGDPEFGGQGLPLTIGCSLGDIFTGANCSFYLNTMLGVGVAHVIEKYGPDWMKDNVIPKMYDGSWGGTMVLTEPSAGSDVGAAKTKAEKTDKEGVYKISGSKIFITAGDQDMTDNIIHLVLARTPDAPKGVKGLSIFIVPKNKIDTDGNDLGEFNDVTCVGIEHKMGIHGSSTCQLAFGEAGNCEGWLLGNEGDGIKIMFNMMNEARIEVGLQGCSLSNAAYQNAKTYAHERIQGPSIDTFKDPDAPRVAIVKHPDVRRQLLHMKAFGEAMRGLLHFASYCHDLAMVTEDADEARKWGGISELLTPICKGYCTDRGVELTGMAIQVYGGYGYTKDYPVEQYMRDVKIGCIYEGTNSIQAMDLIARKLPMGKGAVLMSFLGEMDRVANAAKERASLAPLIDTFNAAKEKMTAAAMTLGGWGMQKRFDLATTKAVPFMDVMGDVVMAYELLKAATVADEVLTQRLADAGVDYNDKAALAAHLADSSESAFYHGKLMSAQYFINSVLPRVSGNVDALTTEDLSHMELVYAE